MFAHGVRSLFPPAAVVEQHINAFKNYPQGLATAKTIGGLPIRLSDRDVAVFVKFGKEMSLLKGNRDRLVRNRDIREAKGLSTQKLDDQIDTMEERIKDLNKEYSKRAADMGKRKEDEYDDKLDDITRRRK